MKILIYSICLFQNSKNENSVVVAPQKQKPVSELYFSVGKNIFLNLKEKSFH